MNKSELYKLIRETIKQFLTDDITIPINIGDTVLGGKFKNKRIVVKSIEKNEKGDITINGRPLMKFRLLEPLTESSKLKLSIPSDILQIHNHFKKHNKKLFSKYDKCGMKD